MKIENKGSLKEIVFSILFVSGEGLEKEFILQKFCGITLRSLALQIRI